MKRLLVIVLVLPLLCGFTFRRRFHNGFPAEWNVGRYSDFSIQQAPSVEKSIEGKVVKIVDGGTIWVVDEHNRTRRVKLNGINVNIAMIREGCARHDRLVNKPEFAAAEKIARTKKIGMWGTPSAVPKPGPR